MKNLIISFIALILSGQALAAGLPESKQQFCARFETTGQNQDTILDLSLEASNLMSFKNNGGLFNGGVCWWHSRFQRNILYLGIFRPDLEKPKNTREIQKIIELIRAGKSVVVVPGYANFSEFTEENQKLIQSELNSWQLYDGVILGSWIDGLKGDTKVNPDALKMMMDKVYNYVEVEKKIAYQKLQIKGITSHAWLVIGLKKGNNGYEIGLIDSNNPRMTENYSYKFGDDSFNKKSYGNFVPYLEFTREEQRLVSVAKAFCGLRALSDSDMNKWDDDYKLDLAEAYPGN